MEQSDNTVKTDKPKRKAPRTAWKPGQSGNPKGAPKDGESWAAIIKEISNMPPDEIFELVGKTNGKINDLGRAYKQMPPKVVMKKLVVARVLAALMFDPNSSLLNTLMERAEGKVPDVLKGDGDDGEIVVRLVRDAKS